MALPLIELKNVSVAFHGDFVLKNIHVQVFEHDAISIVGPSGQGKSTLLKVMATLQPPTEGSVIIQGTDFYKASNQEQQKIRLRMGMLFQKNALFDSLSNGENIAFPLREMTTKSPDEINQIVDRFLESVGIAHAKDLFPDEISGGMQKRLGIARALALDPEILFYDDPTAGLDPITSRKIIDLILELKKKRGSTVMSITNDMNRAYQLNGRIWIVMGCHVVDTGNTESTKKYADPRVQQFIRGETKGPLTSMEEQHGHTQ